MLWRSGLFRDWTGAELIAVYDKLFRRRVKDVVAVTG